jgi:predicted neuraminidase
MRNAWSIIAVALICVFGVCGVSSLCGSWDGAATPPAVQADNTGAVAAGEFIFTSAPFPACHASTIVELKDGDLLAAWFGGSAEGRPDVAVWGARRSRNQWSGPMELAREPEIAAYNPVLFFTPDSRLWLYYKFGPNPREWTAARRWSSDQGNTWSAVDYLPAGLLGPIRSKPFVQPDGTIICGSSVESYRSWACWIERSEDGGKNWTKYGPITVPQDQPRAVAAQGAGADGIIQPAIVALGGKRLRFYARSTLTLGKICVSDSMDNGKTWTQARLTDLPNPNSGIDAVTLRDGRIVLVYNHTLRGRTPLNLAVSRNGDHFQMFHVLEDQAGEYSYPALIQGQSGDLHITYTWNRQRIRYVRFPLSAIPRPQAEGAGK